MTARGEQLLREELNRLKTVERPRITAAIAEARSHGDLSENAEYDAAKEEQGLCEARIKDIEAKLASANIIDVTKLKGNGAMKVVFGATVTLLDLNTDKEITYKIVGEDEASIENNLISYKTPIAKGLLGKVEGDEVAIKIPKGTVEYEIVEVKYVPQLRPQTELTLNRQRELLCSCGRFLRFRRQKKRWANGGWQQQL